MTFHLFLPIVMVRFSLKYQNETYQKETEDKI